MLAAGGDAGGEMTQGRLSRRTTMVIGALALAAALIAPQTASAEIPSVFDGDVSCSVESDGVRFCGSSSPRSTTKTWDGVPIDVNVAFPPAPAAGTDGGYPLVMMFHGYGGGKLGLSAMRRFVDRGYATFSMTDRGFRESCGSDASRAADPAGCANGYVRLIDNRYEVRDAQLFAGELVDAGLIDPQRIGAIGGSYGGGMSMALGALKDRMAMPNGSLVPWTSPSGTPMQIAAAAPNIPWSDLAYSLVPNGGTLDYIRHSPYEGPVGVEKESLVSGLYFSGLAAPGFYAPEGSDPSADVTGWRNMLNAGEPYGEAVEAIVDEITTNHSSYYIDRSVEPTPMLMSSGFTDDLFPADETIRYYNRLLGKYPDAHLALFFGDFGHPRAQGKTDVEAARRAAEDAWFDYFIKGEGDAPEEGATAFTQTCPGSAPSGGPYHAKSWARIAPGEIRMRSKPANLIAAGAGDPAIATTFDPVSGGGACAEASGADQPGVATYKLAPAPAGGFTLLGASTVVAKFTLGGDTSQVAARLLDLAPNGTERLIARGLWRPELGGSKKQAFQLHPNGWHFNEGHVAKLELLPADAGGSALSNYGRPSNGQQDITVSKLDLRLPVRDRPGALDGLVAAPAPKFVPKGSKLAPDWVDRDPRAKLAKHGLELRGGRVIARVKCPREFLTCSDGRIEVRGRFDVAHGKFELDGGEHAAVEMRLSSQARAWLLEHRALRVRAKVTSAETQGASRAKRLLKR
jgi:hypothetical protein